MADGQPIGPQAAAPSGGRPIGGASVGGPGPTSGGISGPRTAAALAGPINPEAFAVPGQSVEAPGAYFGGSPVGGPSSIFNIGGAPIAILGGVFGDGLPLGGPVTQIFRSGGPVPNTLFISTLESSGPIGQFFIGEFGATIGGTGEVGAPIGELAEAGAPIGPSESLGPVRLGGVAIGTAARTEGRL